ncbi:MAG: polyketide antibiotic transporter [Solirubrobacteraceae bacterium]
MATVASTARPRRSPVGWGPPAAVARRVLRDGRTRTLAFSYLFAAVAYIQPVSYRHTYPTIADRLAFAHAFGANKAVVLFYGKAYDLLTVGGYSAWRVGGLLSLFSAVFGLLAAVRAMRADEDTGRTELVLAGIVGRRAAYVASLAAIGAATALLWVALLAGSAAARLSLGGSAYLALAVVSVVPVFVGVGAVTSQLAPTRRMALELGGAFIALSFLLRVIADTSSGAGWLRWATPLGWAEELRPFTGARPAVLVLAAAASAVLLIAAAQVALRRDIGAGVLSAKDTASPRLALLSSPTQQALRSERTSLLVWLASIGLFALVVGIISDSVSSAGISKQLDQELAKLGSGSVLNPRGYLSFSFLFFVVAISLFACSQVAAARHEEADERLETLLSQPVSRRRWLGGRLALAGAAASVISVAAGVLAWVGAASQGVEISLPTMVGAGANCLPCALLFLGLAALAYAVAPRAGSGIAYGLVAVAFLWQLFGALLGAPKWVVDLTPFAHVGLVPAQPFDGVGAAVTAAIGILGATSALWLFARRDLIGA